jgi:hypothetical protein
LQRLFRPVVVSNTTFLPIIACDYLFWLQSKKANRSRNAAPRLRGPIFQSRIAKYQIAFAKNVRYQAEAQPDFQQIGNCTPIALSITV